MTASRGKGVGQVLIELVWVVGSQIEWALNLILKFLFKPNVLSYNIKYKRKLYICLGIVGQEIFCKKVTPWVFFLNTPTWVSLACLLSLSFVTTYHPYLTLHPTNSKLWLCCSPLSEPLLHILCHTSHSISHKSASKISLLIFWLYFFLVVPNLFEDSCLCPCASC